MRLGNYICNLAENAYLREKGVFGIDLPGKTPVVIQSNDEFSYGDADPFTDKIVLNEYFGVNEDSTLLPPYQELVAHELAHIFTFKYLSGNINLYKRMLSLGLMPLWLIEGLAQYVGESWNSCQDSYMRSVSLDNKFMSLSDLNSFYYYDLEKRHCGYLESFALVKFIFEQLIPDQGIAAFLKAYSRNPFRLEQVFKSLTGKDVSAVYQEYLRFYQKKYEKDAVYSPSQSRSIKSFSFPAKYQRYPRFSPDGKTLALIADQKRELHQQNDLYFCDLLTSKYRKVLTNIDPFYDFSPDGETIVYSHLYFSEKARRYLYDVFQLDISSGKKRRLTTDFSARFPCYLSNCSVAFIRYNPFGNGVYQLNLNSGECKMLFPENTGYYFYALRAREGKLLASAFDGHSRQVVLLDQKGGLSPLTNFPDDNRIPVATENGLFFLHRTAGEKSVIYELAESPVTDKETTGVYFSQGVLYQVGDFSRDILDFDLSGNLLAVATYEKSSYTIRVCDTSNLFKKQIVAPVCGTTAVDLRGLDYPVRGYDKKLNLSAFTPWGEYDDEGRVGLLTSMSDFIGYNNFLGKFFYNLETKRFGEKIDFISRDYAFTTNFSYENNVYQSHYGDSEYIKRNETLDLQFDYPFNPKEVVFWGLENKKISSVELDPPILPPPFQGNINLLKIGYKFFKLRSSPDWDINPRDGRSLRFDFRKADRLLGSEVDYNEYRAQWEEYLTLHHNPQSLFLRSAYGIKDKISTLNSPILYGIGGLDTVRGFETDYKFGTRYLLLTGEFRFPLYARIVRPKIGYLYLNKLFGVLFYDSGNCWYSGRPDWSDFLSSCGAEFRLKSLVVGKLPVITRLGYAVQERNGSGNSTFLKFELPLF